MGTFVFGAAGEVVTGLTAFLVLSALMLCSSLAEGYREDRRASAQAGAGVRGANLLPLIIGFVNIALFASPVLGGEHLPPVRKGTPYPAAREALLLTGYRPERVPIMSQKCEEDRLEVCNAYAEAEGCSVEAPVRCTFLWRKSNALIEVATTGEEALLLKRLRCRSGCE